MKPNADTSPSSPSTSTVPYYGSPYGMNVGGGAEPPGMLSLRRLVRVAFRKWWLIALGVALGVSAAWFYLSRVTPLYMAQALIEMSVRRPRITAQRGPVSDDTDFYTVQTEELFNTRIQKFGGTRMREIVAANIRSHTNHPALTSEQISEVLGGTGFGMVRRSYLVRITSVSTNPVVAGVGANAFAEGAVQLSIEENRIASDNAVAWLEQQALQQQKALDKITQSVTAFREEKRMDAIANEKATLLASQAAIGSQLTELENGRILADKLLAAIKDVSLDPKNAGSLPDATPRRDEIVQAAAKWQSAMQEHDALLARYTPDHPEVVARSKAIVGLGSQVSSAVQRAQRTAESNLLLLEQQTAALRQRMEAQSRAAADLETQLIRIRAELETLERERGVAEMSYRGLLTRIEEARISADENTATVKIVEPARTPSAPFSPRRARLLALAILLGLSGGCGLAILVEMVEDRFVGTEDLEAELGLPVLGMVPRLQGKKRSVIGQTASRDRFGHGAEAFAGVRAKIMASATGHHHSCLLITSAGPREGKTITATNLAISFARSGIRTLLVDFDMRRPQVKSVFGLSDDSPCLLEVLGNGKVDDFPSLPTATDCPNLSVVGNHASQEFSAAEIMGRQIVKDFVAWARASYDLVILDSPPFGVVSDALMLAGLVDGVLFVSRPGVSRRHTLRSVVDEFNEAEAPILGVVVNGVNFNRLSFLSNYDYRYGRGYQTYRYPTKAEAKE